MDDLVDLQQTQVKRRQEIDMPPDGMALNLFQAVYRNPNIDLSIRMRAAAQAIGYEAPRLAVVAQVTENDIATLLDRRIARLQEMENAKLIEAKPTRKWGQRRCPTTAPIPDRRYRRF